MLSSVTHFELYTAPKLLNAPALTAEINQTPLVESDQPPTFRGATRNLGEVNGLQEVV
jgi:hypothetical protein